MKIAVFLPNWLGDLVMATPTLRALRRHFGVQARLVGILRPYLSDLLAGTDWLDEQWSFDPRAEDRDLRSPALVRRLWRQRFDLAVMLTNSLRTAAITWLGRARGRVGYVRYGRGPLLTQKLYPPKINGRLAAVPMVELYLAVAEAIGCAPESRRLELAVTPAEDQLGQRIWRSLGLRQDGRVIALNSSGAYGAAKLWPVGHFAALAQQIVDTADHDVLVVCGPNERDLARDIVALARRPRVFSLADEPVGIAATKSCLRRCRLLVSTDSGPRHIAAAFGKPVITLLGPTSPVWIENPTVRAVNLQLPLDCIACYHRRCPLGHHRCMADLRPEMVFAAVEQLFTEDDRPAIAA